MATLDLSHNEKLTTLDVTRTKLKSLDISKNKNLTDYYIAGLGWSDLSSVKELQDLMIFACFCNAFSKEVMQRIVTELPDRKGKETGVIWIVDTKTQTPVEHNVCTKSQVLEMLSKNYAVFDFRDFENDGMNNYEGVDDEDTAIRSLAKGTMEVAVESATREVRVRFAEAQLGQMARAFDMTGQSVFSQKIEATEMLLPLAKLPRGQYLLFVGGEATLFSL